MPSDVVAQLHPGRERKNVNLPGVIVDLPTLTAKDEVDLVEWGVPNDIDFIAASFVRKGSDLDYIRKARRSGKLLFAAGCSEACRHSEAQVYSGRDVSSRQRGCIQSMVAPAGSGVMRCKHHGSAMAADRYLFALQGTTVIRPGVSAAYDPSAVPPKLCPPLRYSILCILILGACSRCWGRRGGRSESSAR